jgi:FkbM family methyltransferase
MKSASETPSRRKPGPLVPWRLALAGVTGLVIALGASRAAPTAIVLFYKATGKGQDCSWAKSASVIPEALKLFDGSAGIKGQLKLLSHDNTLDIDQFQAPERSYWIKHSGAASDGKDLLAYLISEHRWMAQSNPKQGVRQGDIVIDCGAHVGTFTDEALRGGAQTVVAVEPEPVNAECFKRNFRSEIASGRVILVEKGVWSSETTLQLSVANANSGMNSFVSDQGAEKLSLPVTTIDKLVQQLGLPRVDFIKMDIEGAEREALKGGLESMRRYRPRLMLEMYHRPDDRVVLPAIVRQAHPDYNIICGPCDFDQQTKAVIPHVFYIL